MNNLIDKTNSKATKISQEIFPNCNFFQSFLFFIYVYKRILIYYQKNILLKLRIFNFLGSAWKL